MIKGIHGIVGSFHPDPPMKITLLASAALLFAAATVSANSPVGTWEVALSGADRGTAYVTFEADHEFTAYGLRSGAAGLFTLAGVWSVDDRGRLTGSYTETTQGAAASGTLTGKVAPKKIGGTIASSHGIFSFKAKPEAATPDFSGTWTAVVAIGKERQPEIYEVTPTALPHVFHFAGTGFSPLAGEYPVLGTLVAGAKGNVELVAFSWDPWGAAGFSTLRGKVNPARRKSVLRGSQTTGKPLKISLGR